MSFELAEGYIDLTTESRPLEATMSRVRAKLVALQGVMLRVSAAARNALFVGGAAIGFMVKQASDAEETMSKFETVFKTQAGAAKQFAADLSKQINRSKYDLMGYMASLQDMFVPFGFARDKATELSEKVTVLAEDLASFNNLNTADVLRDLQSAMVGNHETVRKYGVIITETTLNQELMNMGIAGGTKAATEQQKVLARLAMIIKGNSDAQGDAARTANSFANRLKGLRATIKDLSVEVGSALSPSLGVAIEKFRSALQPVTDWISKHKELTANIIYTTGAVLAVLAAWPLYTAAVWVCTKAIVALQTALIALRITIMFLAQNPLVALLAALAALAGYLIYTRTEGENFGEKMHTVAVNIVTAWLWLKEKLANLWVAILPVWNTALTWIKTAFQVVGFVFKNFDDMVTLGLLMATLTIVKFANDVKYIFTTVIPTYLLWFYNNWKNIFMDLWNGTKAILTNLWTNMKNFFQAVKDWISGKGFNFEWTGLLEGFKRTTEQLPDIAKRQMSPFEEGLQTEIDRIGGELGKKFADTFEKVPDVAAKAEKAVAPAQAASKSASSAAAAGQQAMKSSAKVEFVSAGDMWKKLASNLTAKDAGKQQLAEAKKQTDELKKTNKHLEKVAQNTERKQGPGTVGP
jgi:hypothetical protein